MNFKSALKQNMSSVPLLHSIDTYLGGISGVGGRVNKCYLAWSTIKNKMK